MNIVPFLVAVCIGAYFHESVFPIAKTVMFHLSNLFHDLIKFAS